MYKYQIDDDIINLSHRIEKNVYRLRPDYLKIEKLANEIIKYAKVGIKYNEK